MKRTALFCLLAAAMLFSCTKENKQDETDDITTPGEPPKEDVIVDVTSIELRKTEVEMDITLTEGKIIEVVSTTPHVEERHLNASIVSGEDVISIERDERGWRVRPLKVGTADVRIVPDHGPAEKHCTVKVSEGNVADAKPVTKLSASKTSFVLKDLIMDGFSYSIDKVTVPFEIEPEDAVFGDDIVVTVDREDVLNISFENKEVTIAAKPNMSHKPSETGTFNVYDIFWHFTTLQLEEPFGQVEHPTIQGVHCEERNASRLLGGKHYNAFLFCLMIFCKSPYRVLQWSFVYSLLLSHRQ